jgi:hypothetical protein
MIKYFFPSLHPARLGAVLRVFAPQHVTIPGLDRSLLDDAR